MAKAKHSKKYPMLAIRMKAHELAYIRREADDKKLSVAQYVKRILVPFRDSIVVDDKI